MNCEQMRIEFKIITKNQFYCLDINILRYLDYILCYWNIFLFSFNLVQKEYYCQIIIVFLHPKNEINIIQHIKAYQFTIQNEVY